MEPERHSALLEGLPVAHRLALSYAPRSSRASCLALLALDQRLAGILRKGQDPLLTRIRMAWWRERLQDDRQAWPEGEPLLALLRDWQGEPAQLAALVDGWEAMIDAPLSNGAAAAFAQGRGQAWQALANAVGIAPERADIAQKMGSEWALADLLIHLGDAEERDSVRPMVAELANTRVSLPRSLRPLAVLHALALRAAKRDASELFDGAGAGWLALRMGLFGR